jgi:hypothetical protein
MSVFTLDKEHPLTRAGLRLIRLVEKVELGLKPGDVVFEFPFGRIVDNGMACRRERIIPLGVEIMPSTKKLLPLGHPATKKSRKRNTSTSCSLGGGLGQRRGGCPLVNGS